MKFRPLLNFERLRFVANTLWKRTVKKLWTSDLFLSPFRLFFLRILFGVVSVKKFWSVDLFCFFLLQSFGSYIYTIWFALFIPVLLGFLLWGFHVRRKLSPCAFDDYNKIKLIIWRFELFKRWNEVQLNRHRKDVDQNRNIKNEIMVFLHTSSMKLINKYNW